MVIFLGGWIRIGPHGLIPPTLGGLRGRLAFGLSFGAYAAYLRGQRGRTASFTTSHGVFVVEKKGGF